MARESRGGKAPGAEGLGPAGRGKPPQPAGDDGEVAPGGGVDSSEAAGTPKSPASGGALAIGPNRFGGEAVGVEILEAGPDRVRARVQAGPQHHQPYGILHGGVYCAIVEDVASHGAGRAVVAGGQLRTVVGVSNQTDFLRSHAEGELLAEGTPVHVGRRQQLWQVEIRRSRDGALVARGQVRFHVLPEAPWERRARQGTSSSPVPPRADAASDREDADR